MKAMTDMERAHADDYAQKRRFDELRHTIETFLEDIPDRCAPALEKQLREAVGRLEDQSAHIVAVWD